jgi:hypothetical protein
VCVVPPTCHFEFRAGRQTPGLARIDKKDAYKIRAGTGDDGKKRRRVPVCRRKEALLPCTLLAQRNHSKAEYLKTGL